GRRIEREGVAGQKKGRLFHPGATKAVQLIPVKRRKCLIFCWKFPLPPIGTLDPPIFRRGWLTLSAERNADGYRLQCLARALVGATLFVSRLGRRLALADGEAARDHPPLIGNGLRDPIADETLAGLVLSGHAIAASSGLGLIILVAIPVGLAGLLPYERSCGGAHMTIGNRDGDLLIMMRDGGARQKKGRLLQVRAADRSI